MSRLKGGEGINGGKEGKRVLEPARVTKGVAKRWKENEKRSNREKQEPLVVTEERPGTGIFSLRCFPWLRNSL